MLRGLWKLTWIEIKVFLREPLGAFGTIGVPVLIFVVLGVSPTADSRLPHFQAVDFPAPVFLFWRRF